MKIAVIIPAYKCKDQILTVLSAIPPLVSTIFVVDDSCPLNTGDYVTAHCKDPRVQVLRHTHNQGVGGAMCTGYKHGLAEDAEIFVKLDGDGQMDPSHIPRFVEPILDGRADYTKGNRFTSVEDLRKMPLIRLIGNLGLSFMNKLSSGYWKILDPTNGYTAIHRTALSLIPFEKISKRYFFESDFLFRLGLVGAKVVDIPVASRYADEISHLSPFKSLFEFSGKHLRNALKRLIYRYFLLDFNLASIEIVFGLFLVVFGLTYGGYNWWWSLVHQTFTSTGTVVLSSTALLMGLQLILAFLSFDMTLQPTEALQSRHNR
ncbi:MAG: glycosyl transferase family 2 [Bdellovibrio sp. CG10_big_fil_rev_8_21_14_0_10_47_8]|nr:MAG: glycosyl transferase family 2 [Bdellovibrio sp. CG10_big_fil_rev_8_21_14_0_10_47_8]